MSDKDRKKKDGQRKDKKNERMREDVQRRHDAAQPKEQEDRSDDFRPKSTGDQPLGPR